jgi:hypothetical protein
MSQFPGGTQENNVNFSAKILSQRFDVGPRGKQAWRVTVTTISIQLVRRTYAFAGVQILYRHEYM